MARLSAKPPSIRTGYPPSPPLQETPPRRGGSLFVRPYAAAARELTALYGRFYQPFGGPGLSAP